MTEKHKEESKPVNILTYFLLFFLMCIYIQCAYLSIEICIFLITKIGTYYRSLITCFSSQPNIAIYNKH